MTTTFFNADGDQVQTTNPDVQTSISGLRRRRADLLHLGPDQRGHLADGQSRPAPTPTCARPPHRPPPPPGRPPATTTTVFDPPGGRCPRPTRWATPLTTPTTRPGTPPPPPTRGARSPPTATTGRSGTGQCAASAPAGGGSLDDLYSTTTPATSADPRGRPPPTPTTPATPPTPPPPRPGPPPTPTTLPATSPGWPTRARPRATATPANQSYTYNVDGTRHTMTDGTGTTTYTYDANGDITQQPSWPGAAPAWPTQTVAYGYFTTGVQSSVTYPVLQRPHQPRGHLHLRRTGATWPSRPTGWATRSPSPTTPTGTSPPRTTRVSTSNPSGTSSHRLLLRQRRPEHPGDLHPQLLGDQRDPHPVLLGHHRIAQPRRPGDRRTPTPTPARVPGRPPTSATTATTRPAGSSTRVRPPRGPVPTTSPTTPRGIPPRSPATTPGGNFDTYTQASTTPGR